MARTVAAITGASSGIGAIFAKRLAPEYDLLLIARRKGRLDALAAELSNRHGTLVETIQADLTEERDLDLVAQRIRSEERLALLVNNAGFGAKGRFWEAPFDIHDRMHKLHIDATMRLTHAALRNMVPRDSGGIVNISSVAAYIRRAGNVTYSSTKSWMNVFTEGLYVELKKSGSNVVVQALCPGFTHTEFHGKMGVDPDRLASPGFWLNPHDVVDASLDGLRRRKLFVIPGWRYRLLTSFLTKLPTNIRLIVEEASTRNKGRYVAEKQALNRLEDGE